MGRAEDTIGARRSLPDRTPRSPPIPAPDPSPSPAPDQAPPRWRDRWIFWIGLGLAFLMVVAGVAKAMGWTSVLRALDVRALFR